MIGRVASMTVPTGVEMSAAALQIQVTAPKTTPKPIRGTPARVCTVAALKSRTR